MNRLGELRRNIRHAWLLDETACVRNRAVAAQLEPDEVERVQGRAASLVEKLRRERRQHGMLDAFLHEYSLSSEEGVVLMCLAEALLRIPDDATADQLIQEKIGHADWRHHLGPDRNWLVNAATWGLMVTGRVIDLQGDGWLEHLISRHGESLIRKALRQGMRIMAEQFVMGADIEAAVIRAQEQPQLRYSYDMLGEAALTAYDVERYVKAYHHAIDTLAGCAKYSEHPNQAPSMSVKLSALHPRYEFAQRARVLRELTPRLLHLAQAARAAHIGLTLDAEEADRLDLSLDLFQSVYLEPSLSGWDGFGLAVQAYQKRALNVLQWLVALAREQHRRIPVRLVKGAYWDTEIKRAQVAGLSGYPVFTRKCSTDVSYLACARYLFGVRDAIYPQFATHNAHTVSYILELAGTDRDFEFQRLHGMGEALFQQVVGADNFDAACRVYCPVGAHDSLLPYLVRRLLENGANTSFVNRLSDEHLPIAEVVADPVNTVNQLDRIPHPRLPLPHDLYGERPNSSGLNLADEETWRNFDGVFREQLLLRWQARPRIDGQDLNGVSKVRLAPAFNNEPAGDVVYADADALRHALDVASHAFAEWRVRPVSERAAMLRKFADLLEQNRPQMAARIVKEGGRCVADALSEIREAVDFARYYAQEAERLCQARPLPGPTGELNIYRAHGRGVFLCISPWNFPLAIFAGQVCAALVTGNTVLAKPASQTTLTAQLAVDLLRQAGIPDPVLQFVPAPGKLVGEVCLPDRRVAGVCFTGSTVTAQGMQQTLAHRGGPIVPLLAETGGINVMLVDSSALLEQVVSDVLVSAFNSAGQRCSALRLLLVQNDVAERLEHLLAGAMQELQVGDPADRATDVGPVIDSHAHSDLLGYIEEAEERYHRVHRIGAPTEGQFVGPHIFVVNRIAEVGREVFGPILHIAHFSADQLDDVVDQVNALGYGLTLGLQTRLEETRRRVLARAKVGNIYINRNMIGAVVGVQPFGGEALSGTGPKAGGPLYLTRFLAEQHVCENTAAAGGNAALMSLG